MEEHDLAITSTDANFVVGYCLNIFNTLGTNRLRKNKHFVFNLERTEISRFSSCKQKLLVWLRESKTSVISHHGSSLHQLILARSLHWIQWPKSQLFGACNSKLIVSGVSQLYVLDKSTPSKRCNSIWEDLGSHLYGRDNMSIRSVPNKHFSIQLIACWNEKLIIVRESQVLNGVVMLGQPIHGLFGIVVPNDHVWVISFLAYNSKHKIF